MYDKIHYKKKKKKKPKACVCPLKVKKKKEKKRKIYFLALLHRCPPDIVRFPVLSKTFSAKNHSSRPAAYFLDVRTISASNHRASKKCFFYSGPLQNCCCCLVAKSCLIFCDPVDCSPPGSSVQGISHARILEWSPFSAPGDLPNPGIEPVSPASLLHCRWILLPLSHHFICSNMCIKYVSPNLPVFPSPLTGW